MSSSDAGTDTSTGVSEVGTIDMKLEVVTLPVSDVDRAKSFYQSLGWRLDADFAAGDAFRGVQFTPPRSQCSIHFGKGITTAEPGSVQRLELVVEDIDADTLRQRDPKKLIPPLHGALLKNEQDVHLFERLAFLNRRESR